MDRYRRPHNPVLHLETARAFSQMRLPDFDHVQDWALVQAFAALFKTRRVPAYWLRHIQFLMKVEHDRRGGAGDSPILSQKIPRNYQGRTVLKLTHGEEKIFVLFSSPSPLVIAKQQVFYEISCPICLYAEPDEMTGFAINS